MKWIPRKPDKDANKLCMILETRGFIARLMFVKLLSNCQLELLSLDGVLTPNATNFGKVSERLSIARLVKQNHRLTQT